MAPIVEEPKFHLDEEQEFHLETDASEFVIPMALLQHCRPIEFNKQNITWISWKLSIPGHGRSCCDGRHQEVGIFIGRGKCINP